MTKEQHREAHKKLHESLDMLIADFINHTGKLPSKTTCMELMEWAHKQTIDPTPTPGTKHDDEE